MRRQISVIALLLCLVGCGLGNADTERQEVLDRVRALGVEVSPLVPQIPAEGEAAKTVALTLHAAIPGDSAATVLPFRNNSRPGANVVLGESDIVIDSANIKEQKIGNLRFLAVPATANVPSQKSWRGAKGGTVQYGFKIVTADRIEYVSGEFLAYVAGEERLAWQSPKLEVSFPTDGATIEKDKAEEIQMVVTKSQDEIIFPGWFVSRGVVNNRRAELSTWKPLESGEHALVATARGMDSFGFAIKIIKVTVP